MLTSVAFLHFALSDIGRYIYLPTNHFRARQTILFATNSINLLSAGIITHSQNIAEKQSSKHAENEKREKKIKNKINNFILFRHLSCECDGACVSVCVLSEMKQKYV